jgi:hypothetical protein
MKAATKNFDAENKVGEGGFSSVYKVTACLMVAVICPNYIL